VIGSVSQTNAPFPVLQSILEPTAAQMRALNATPIAFPGTANGGSIAVPLSLQVLSNVTVAFDVIIGVRLRYTGIAQDLMFTGVGLYTVGNTGLRTMLGEAIISTALGFGVNPKGLAIELSSGTGPATTGNGTFRFRLLWTPLPVIAGY